MKKYISFDGKTKQVLPKCILKPANHRIVCAEYAYETKLKSGIIMPSIFGNDENKRNKLKKRNRWFVVSVSDRVNIRTSSGRKLRPGDEILIADNVEAVEYTVPVIHDYHILSNEMAQTFVVFDETEIGGTIECKFNDPINLVKEQVIELADKVKSLFIK